MDRIEDAYIRFKKIWGGEELGSEHSSVLYPDEAMDLIQRVEESTNYEEDFKYKLILRAFGAGYMLGYEEGCKVK